MGARLKSWRVRSARAAFGGALLCSALGVASAGANAQSWDNQQTRSIFDEFRIGLMAHDVEPGGNEDGLDFGVELLFRSPYRTSYGNAFADFLFQPRFHLGSAINLSSDTSQVYAGLTWNIPLGQAFTFEVSLGGAIHDGPTGSGGDHSFGCTLNFRESASIGYALSERWRLYGTVTHMSNANLCDHNSGLTSAGVRLGYNMN